MPSQALSWRWPLACHAGKCAPEKLAIDRIIMTTSMIEPRCSIDKDYRRGVFRSLSKMVSSRQCIGFVPGCGSRPAHPGPHSKRTSPAGATVAAGSRQRLLPRPATSALGSCGAFSAVSFKADVSSAQLVIRRRDGEAQTRKSAFRHEVRLSMSRPNWRPQPRRVLAGSARYGVVGTASRVGPPDKALMSEDQNHGQGS